MSTPKISIATCADKNFLFPMAIMLKSLCLQHSGEIIADLLVTGFSEKDRRSVEAIASDIELRWHVIDTYWEMLPENLQNVTSKASYARLLLPEILPNDRAKILYLDADVVACHTLQSLWNQPLPKASSMAAVYDAFIPWAASPEGTAWQSLGLSPEMPYFNAGVMLIDLEKWRKLGIGRQAIDLARNHRLPYDDQCALNAIIKGDWTPISPTWNFQTAYTHGWHYGWINYGEKEFQSACDNPSIIHYTSGQKPWLTNEHPLSQRFYDIVDKTSFAGWRPSQSEMSEPQRDTHR